MVRKCCVPKCSSSARIPSHRLPIDRLKAHTWLRAIGLSNMIDAPKETMTKLRICALHFAEDMILPYGQKRRLVDNAMPTLDLINVDAADGAATSSVATDAASQFSNNVKDNSNFDTIVCEKQQVINDNRIYTRNASRFHKKLRRYKKLLCKRNKTIYMYRQRKPSHENIWQNVTADLPTIQRTFLNVFQNFRHTSQGYRYDIEQKALPLILFKTMGKHAYTCLRDVFKHLPATQTLQYILQNTPLSPGLNPLILRHLKDMSLKMLDTDKVCILMWDKVPLQSNITYDIQRDIICGFEDWNNNRTSKFTDHALVFMLRGLNTGWEMPVSYNFCARTRNTTRLIRCIKEHVHRISKAGFHIIATVCDQKSSNVAAIKELLLQTNRKRKFEKRAHAQTFEVGNVEIVPLYNSLDLIKDVRNNLLTKDLAKGYENNNPKLAASWDVIKAAWTIDRRIHTIRPVLKEISKEHIIENEIKKTHLRYATQVLSGKVASCIETLARFECVAFIDNDEKVEIDAKNGIATAETLNFFSNLFDSVNSKVNSEIDNNDLQSPVIANSAHHAFWRDAKRILRDMNYVDKTTGEIVKSISVLKNWAFTIKGFEKIWKAVHLKYGFNNLKTHYCNQDTIENFFSVIKSHTIHNTNPTPQQFQDSFISLLVSNMKSVSIISGNCETTEDYLLFSLEEYLEDDIPNIEIYDAVDKSNDNDESHEMLADIVYHEELNINFLSNEIITTITKELNYCRECNDNLKTGEFLILARQIICRINKLLETQSHQHNILKALLQHFNNWNINIDWHKCIEHHANIFETVLRVITIKVLARWCKKKNILIYNLNDDLNCNLLCMGDVIKTKQVCERYKLKYKKKSMLTEYRNSIKKQKEMTRLI